MFGKKKTNQPSNDPERPPKGPGSGYGGPGKRPGAYESESSDPCCENCMCHKAPPMKPGVMKSW